MAYRVMHFKGNENERRKQWLAYRQNGIGGSDAAAVLGISKWKSPATLWMEKTGKLAPEDLSDNQYAEWGVLLEEVVANKFKAQHPEMKIRRMNGCYQSVNNPHMLATLDRVITLDDGSFEVLEIKTANAYATDDWADGVPVYYRAQVMHYLAVTGWKRAHVAVLIGGNDYREFVIDREEEEIDFIIEREREYWYDFVLADVQPEITGTADEADALFRLYHDPADDYVQVSDDELIDKCDQIRAAKAQKKELDKVILLAENELKNLIGDKQGAISTLVQAKWVRTVALKFNAKQFKLDNQELAEQYITAEPKNMGIRITEIKAG